MAKKPKNYISDVDPFVQVFCEVSSSYPHMRQNIYHGKTVLKCTRRYAQENDMKIVSLDTSL